MYLRSHEFLKVNESSFIKAEICFVKCKLYDGIKHVVTRRWFEPKHYKLWPVEDLWGIISQQLHQARWQAVSDLQLKRIIQQARHPMNPEDLQLVLDEALALYRCVRPDPSQLEGLLKSRQATVRQSGALKIAYVFKRASRSAEFVLEPCAGLDADRAVDCGDRFRSLRPDDVLLSCSVALIGSDGEEAGLGRLTRPIGADPQPTVSSYFKTASSDS